MKILAIIFGLVNVFSSQFIYCNDDFIGLILKNQYNQISGNVTYDYLIPNNFGIIIKKHNHNISLNYGYNAYFTQYPSFDVEYSRYFTKVLGEVCVFASINHNDGLTHLFSGKISNEISSYDKYKKPYIFNMIELGIFGGDYYSGRVLKLEGSLRLGLVVNMSGQSEIVKYMRVPLNCYINYKNVLFGLAWDYLVHENMTGWDVENIKFVLGYTINS